MFQNQENSRISTYKFLLLTIHFITASYALSLTLQNQLQHTHHPIPSETDIEIIQNQLGYLPPNFHSVSARSINTHTPIAIQTYPLGGGSPQRRAKAAQTLTPFPTLFWLTCPQVSKAISNLERKGVAKLLEDRLYEDDDHAIEKMMKCHEEYAKLRWSSLSVEDRQFLLSGGSENVDGSNQDQYSIEIDENQKQKNKFQGFCDILQKSGVAGTDWNRKDGSLPSVKCLHAHYAHYRSVNYERSTEGINIIGQWTHELLCEQGHDFL